MPSKPSAAQLYDELLTRYGREVADAFQAAVQELRTAAEFQRLVLAIQARNVEAAIEAMHIEAAAYGPLLDALDETFAAGGQFGADLLPAKGADGLALVFRFSGRNSRAETWLRDYSASLVSRIAEDQRTALRSALVAGMEAGRNPTSVALEIVGRVNKATGKREGGILGLTSQQEGFLRNARTELQSGDPASLANYLKRGKRDARFDGAVRRSLKSGEPIPADKIAAMAKAYERRLLKLRGDTIGRTEALTALNAGAYEALRQAVDEGKIEAAAIRRTWRSASDLRVRDTHVALNGDTVGLDEPFVSPSGARMLYPGDVSLGAPAAERINCRCFPQVRIDFLSNL